MRVVENVKIPERTLGHFSALNVRPRLPDEYSLTLQSPNSAFKSNALMRGGLEYCIQTIKDSFELLYATILTMVAYRDFFDIAVLHGLLSKLRFPDFGHALGGVCQCPGFLVLLHTSCFAFASFGAWLGLP
jgi:hypothetical protein